MQHQTDAAPYTITLNTNNGFQTAQPKGEEEVKKDVLKPKTSYWEALVHMFRGTVGTGILALPLAFSQAGYIGGIVGVIAATFLVNYCSVLLARCQVELSSRRKGNPDLTYQGTVEAAFTDGPKMTRSLAPAFVVATNVLLLIGQIGSVCVYVIFISSNVKAALDPYIGEHSLREYTIWLAVPMLAMNMVISLKRLAFVSSLGNIVLLSSVIIVMYYSIKDLAAVSSSKMFGSINNLTTFFGTVFFASGCLTLVLPLQSEMKSPNKLVSRFGVLNMNAFASGSLYCIFGLLGYLNYGADANATVTLNLPQNDMLAKMVQIFLALSTMTATALQNYITITIIWEDYLVTLVKERVVLAEYCLRVSIVFITVAISLLFPNLETVMAIMGILGQCTLGMTLPCILHILTHYKQPDIFSSVRAFYKEVAVVAFSLFLMIYSLIRTVNEMISTGTS